MPIKQTIDVEQLVSWALDCTGRLPWARDDPRELSLDQGCTARPRRKEHVTWGQAEVYAGLTLHGRPIAGKRRPGDDAQLVLDAIEALEPGAASLVLIYARKRCRPNWLPGVVPERVTRTIIKNQFRRKTVRVWHPCSPAELDAARSDYARWHAALTVLAEALDGRLARWAIVGPRAPAAPWEVEVEDVAEEMVEAEG